MRRVVLSIITISTLVTAGEFRYGHGTFSMEGGFLGLSSSIDTDIDSYSLVERHSNIASSNFFYGYDFTWLDSKILKQVQHTYNNLATKANGYMPINGDNSNGSWKIPSMDYRLQGLDANINLGYDFLHKGEGDFLGISLLFGISMPWINNSSSSKSDNNFLNGNGVAPSGDFYKDSKTEILTYKLGPSISFEKNVISDKLSLYGLATYAYQTGDITNDYAKFDGSVNGTYQEYNIGLHYTPFTKNYKLGWFTLSPRIYATLGYKYSKWKVDDMIVNTSGAELDSKIIDPLKTKFSMDSSIGYFGLGYSF